MNEVIKCLCERKSCKRFLSKQIKKRDLDLILKAGTFEGMGN